MRLSTAKDCTEYAGRFFVRMNNLAVAHMRRLL